MYGSDKAPQQMGEFKAQRAWKKRSHQKEKKKKNEIGHLK